MLHALASEALARQASEALARQADVGPRLAYTGGCARGEFWCPSGWARDRQPDPTVFDGARYPGYLAWANVSFGLSHSAVTTTGVDERVFSRRG